MVRCGARGARLRRPLAAATATAAVAYVVDFKVVPERLTPGFQRRLSPRAVGMSYVAFALGLTLCSIAIVKRTD